MAAQPYDIALHLDEIKDLFHEREIDPLNKRYDAASGIDRIITELKPKSLRQPIRATIFLPPDRVSDGLEKQLSEAIHDYCGVQIHRIEQEMASLRWQGIKALQIGVVFLAACLLLSAFFGGLEKLPEFLRAFLSEGFLIAGWVSLWHPTELLLYEWWPHWRDKRLYERIGDIEIVVAPQTQND